MLSKESMIRYFPFLDNEAKFKQACASAMAYFATNPQEVKFSRKSKPDLPCSFLYFNQTLYALSRAEYGRGTFARVKLILKITPIEGAEFSYGESIEVVKICINNVRHQDLMRNEITVSKQVGLATETIERITESRKHPPQSTKIYIKQHFRGETLEYYLKDRPLGLLQRLDIVIKTCLAVQELHERYDIAHMDIKPGNIAIDSQEKISLIDFGLSEPGIQSKPGEGYRGTGFYLLGGEQGGLTDQAYKDNLHKAWKLYNTREQVDVVALTKSCLSVPGGPTSILQYDDLLSFSKILQERLDTSTITHALKYKKHKVAPLAAQFALERLYVLPSVIACTLDKTAISEQLTRLSNRSQSRFVTLFFLQPISVNFLLFWQDNLSLFIQCETLLHEFEQIVQANSVKNLRINVEGFKLPLLHANTQLEELCQQKHDDFSIMKFSLQQQVSVLQTLFKFLQVYELHAWAEQNNPILPAADVSMVAQLHQDLESPQISQAEKEERYQQFCTSPVLKRLEEIQLAYQHIATIESYKLRGDLLMEEFINQKKSKLEQCNDIQALGVFREELASLIKDLEKMRSLREDIVIKCKLLKWHEEYARHLEETINALLQRSMVDMRWRTLSQKNILDTLEFILTFRRMENECWAGRFDIKKEDVFLHSSLERLSVCGNRAIATLDESRLLSTVSEFTKLRSILYYICGTRDELWRKLDKIKQTDADFANIFIQFIDDKLSKDNLENRKARCERMPAYLGPYIDCIKILFHLKKFVQDEDDKEARNYIDSKIARVNLLFVEEPPVNLQGLFYQVFDELKKLDNGLRESQQYICLMNLIKKLKDAQLSWGLMGLFQPASPSPQELAQKLTIALKSIPLTARVCPYTSAKYSEVRDKLNELSATDSTIAAYVNEHQKELVAELVLKTYALSSGTHELLPPSGSAHRFQCGGDQETDEAQASTVKDKDIHSEDYNLIGFKYS